MTKPRFPSAKDAKEAGWFSRRHETNAAHKEAQKKWRENRSKEARQRRAAERGAPS